jgi:PRC-barrel domain
MGIAVRNFADPCRLVITKQELHMDADARETFDLIGSDKVEGTDVYGADDRKVGAIERVMINKRSGKVAYAVLSFGGFLGMGNDHYPIPWAALVYDTRLGGYRTAITEDQLKGAPKYTGDDWNWRDPERGRKVDDYYGAVLVG